MNKEKYIEEMAKDICGLGRDCHGCTASMSYICKAKKYAERAVDKGYRKADEVAREIIADLEKIIAVDKYGEAKFDVRELYKIEKKYTE